VIPSDPASFREVPPAGTARVAWNFSLAQAPGDTIRLATETLIRCADSDARRAFGRYWILIRPGSGLLRHIMLRLVRREALRIAVEPRA
jgi:hypothetical protein